MSESLYWSVHSSQLLSVSMNRTLRCPLSKWNLLKEIVATVSERPGTPPTQIPNARQGWPMTNWHVAKASQLLTSSWNQFWGAIWALELSCGIRNEPLIAPFLPFHSSQVYLISLFLLRALTYNHLNRNPCLRFCFQRNGLKEASLNHSVFSADSKDVLLWLVHSSWIILQVANSEDALTDDKWNLRSPWHAAVEQLLT